MGSGRKQQPAWILPCIAATLFTLSLAATLSKNSAIKQAPIPADQNTMFEALSELPSSEIPTKAETAHRAISLNSLSSSSPDSLQGHAEATIHDAGLEGQVSALLAAANALAYTILLYTTSRSRSYVMEILQLIAFACFPTLPLVQLINNALKTASDLLHNRSGGVVHTLSCLSGQYVFHEDEQPSLLESRRRLAEVPPQDLQTMRKPRATLTWLFKAGLMLLNLAAALVSLILYFQRPTRSDWETAAIGPDQRLGWTALGGSIAATLTLLAHAASARWTLQQSFSAEEPVSLLWESQVFTEIVLAALLQDAVVAYSGGISLVSVISVFTANRLVLVILFLGFALFNRQLRFFAASVMGSRYRKRWSAVRPIAVVFSVATCASILMFQVLTAFLEQRAARGLD